MFEPVTLWQERLPEAFRERGPRLEHARRLVRHGDRGHARPQAHARRRRQLATARPRSRTRSGCARAAAIPTPGCATWRSDGVVAEVIYPTFGLFIDMIPAADLQMACAQVYNDWLAETFLHRPDVFIPSAVVPVRDVASAAAELDRVAGLGFKAATIPTTPPDGLAVQPAGVRPDLEDRGRRAASRCRCTPAPARSRSSSAGRAARSSTTPRSGCSRPRRSATSPRRACSSGSPTCSWCSSRPAPAGSRTAASGWTRRSRSTSSG